MDTSREYGFDGWTLKATTGELTRGSQRIRLQSQPLAILVELLEQPGQLVTREHLIARLWPKGVVDFDTALNSAVRRLRGALGDHADAPRYIETIPKRGYQFIGGREVDAGAMPQRPETPAALPLHAGEAPGVAARPVRHAGRRPVIAIALLAATAVGAVASTRLDVLRLGTSSETTTSQVQERFQRAEHFFKRRGEDDLELARRYYSEALALDPRYAPAWAGLASVYWVQSMHRELPPDEGLELVRDAAERALELDPDLAIAHLRLANYRSHMGDKRGAADQIERAMKLEPRNPLVLSMAASIAAAKGRMDEAVALQRRSVEADPLTIVSRVNLIAWLTMAERFQEARAELIRVRELNPNHSEGRLNLAELNLLEGRFAEALEMANRMPTGPQRLFVQALALYGLGDEAGSGEAVQALIRSAGEEHPFRVAEALAFCGKPDEAFQWLHGSANRFEDDPLIEYSPFLRTLRLDPRWPVWIRSAERKRDDAAGSRASG